MSVRVCLVFFGLLICSSCFGLSIFTEEDPPYNFTGTDGKPSGMFVEIVSEIQARLQNTDPITIYPWARSYQIAQTNPDIVLFSMARTAERNSQFHWIGPVIENHWVFLAKAGRGVKIKSLEDAKKVDSVGVYRGDSRDDFLTKAGFQNLVRVTDPKILFKMLMAGRIELLAGVDVSAAELARDTGYQPSDVVQLVPFQTVQVYITISKGTQDSTVEAWMTTFEAMKKDGTFAKIYKKYFPTRSLPGKAFIPMTLVR